MSFNRSAPSFINALRDRACIIHLATRVLTARISRATEHFSHVNCEARAPSDHPPRPIRAMADEALEVHPAHRLRRSSDQDGEATPHFDRRPRDPGSRLPRRPTHPRADRRELRPDQDHGHPAQDLPQGHRTGRPNVRPETAAAYNLAGMEHARTGPRRAQGQVAGSVARCRAPDPVWASQDANRRLPRNVIRWEDRRDAPLPYALISWRWKKT